MHAWSMDMTPWNGKTEMSVKVHNIKIPDGRRHQSNHKNEEAINW